MITNKCRILRVMAGSGKHRQLILGMDILLNILNSIIMMLERGHFIGCTAEVSGLARYRALVAMIAIGPLLSTILLSLTIYILIRPPLFPPVAVGATMVSPSVVLLDNHTTTRIGRMRGGGLG